MHRPLLFIAAFSFAAAASAAEPAAPAGDHWVDMGTSDEGRGFLDRRSYRRNGDLVRFTGVLIFHQADEAGATQLAHESEVDCSGRTLRLISLSAQLPDGRIVQNVDVPAEASTPAPIATGTISDTIREEVCRAPAGVIA